MHELLFLDITCNKSSFLEPVFLILKIVETCEFLVIFGSSTESTKFLINEYLIEKKSVAFTFGFCDHEQEQSNKDKQGKSNLHVAGVENLKDKKLP